jgi:hypothetical protein
LRFSHDDRYIFVADAGAPLVHVYRMDRRRWSGKHFPMLGLRVMDNEAFIRGHVNPSEGGPKGIALTSDGRILVASCEEEPIVFLDVRKICGPSAGSNTPSKQPESIAETERVRLSLLGQMNLMAKSRAMAWGQIEVLKKMVAAGNQERDALLQRLNDMKKEEHLK